MKAAPILPASARALTVPQSYADKTGMLAKLKFDSAVMTFVKGYRHHFREVFQEPQFEGQTIDQLGKMKDACRPDCQRNALLLFEETPKEAKRLLNKVILAALQASARKEGNWLAQGVLGGTACLVSLPIVPRGPRPVRDLPG